MDTASIWKGGVLCFGLISYQIWSQGPFHGPAKTPEFFGTPGGPGDHKGVKKGHFGPLQKLLIYSTFYSCKQQLSAQNG